MYSVILEKPNNETQYSSNNTKLEITSCVDKLNTLECRLMKEKNHLDEIYKDRFAYKTMRLFDPLYKEKFRISKSINAVNVTNAWLKCYEILHHFNLFGDITTCVYFDNASFPGSFILATHQYAALKNVKLLWHASSLLESNAENKEPLEDKYDLYRNYPENWMMRNKGGKHAGNNGDITNINNINDFARQFKKKYGTENPVNLYTCDLGFDASADYNNQEQMHYTANLGQILCGLTILAPCGNMIIKHYTLFKRATRSYLALLTTLFNDVIISKPMSSKRTNSETYIICKHYLVMEPKKK